MIEISSRLAEKIYHYLAEFGEGSYPYELAVELNTAVYAERRQVSANLQEKFGPEDRKTSYDKRRCTKCGRPMTECRIPNQCVAKGGPYDPQNQAGPIDLEGETFADD